MGEELCSPGQWLYHAANITPDSSVQKYLAHKSHSTDGFLLEEDKTSACCTSCNSSVPFDCIARRGIKNQEEVLPTTSSSLSPSCSSS